MGLQVWEKWCWDPEFTFLNITKLGWGIDSSLNLDRMTHEEERRNLDGFKNMFFYLCVCVYKCVYMYMCTNAYVHGMSMPWHVCGGQRTTCGCEFFSFIMCVLRIKLRLSGLEENTFTPLPILQALVCLHKPEDLIYWGDNCKCNRFR